MTTACLRVFVFERFNELEDYVPSAAVLYVPDIGIWTMLLRWRMEASTGRLICSPYAELPVTAIRHAMTLPKNRAVIGGSLVQQALAGGNEDSEAGGGLMEQS